MNNSGGITRTRIVATIGPASSSSSCIQDMLDAGVDVFRLNFSHGSLDLHAEAIALIRAAESNAGRPVGIMADLPGPKIRLINSTVNQEIASGSEVKLCLSDSSSEDGLYVDHPEVLETLEPGHRVLLDDGAIRMLVVDRTETHIRCSVLKGGSIRPRVGVNLPDNKITLPAVGETDREFARFAVEQGVDFIAVSFCCHGDDLRSLRDHLGKDASRVHLVAKIERPVAIEHLQDIIEASDVVLVARGDLGVEIDVAEVPLIQKRIVAEARRHGRPVIVATQMLQSMIERSSPTRAEASDVANAILDGTDALMLSGETAIGEHPALVVGMMDWIAQRTEVFADSHPQVESEVPAVQGRSKWMPALARGAWRIATDLDIAYVATWSHSGEAARLLSREGFRMPIVALSDDLSVARRMQVLRGVHAVCVERPKDRDAYRRTVKSHLRDVQDAGGSEMCLALSPPRFDEPGLVDGIELLGIGDEDSV